MDGRGREAFGDWDPVCVESVSIGRVRSSQILDEGVDSDGRCDAEESGVLVSVDKQRSHTSRWKGEGEGEGEVGR